MGIRREGNLWRVQVQIKRRRVSTTARTREEAEQIQAKLRRDSSLSRQGLPADRSLEEALTRWLDEYVPYLKRPEDHQSNLRALVPFCQGLALEDAPIAWQNYLKGAPKVTNSTHNRRGEILKRVCNLAAKKWKWCAPGVAGEIDMLPENPARHIYLTQPQVHELVRTIEGQPAKDLCLIMAYTGLRPVEILGLTRDDIVDGCLVVHIPTAKTKRPRMVPYHDAIREPVKRLPITMPYRTIQKHFDRAKRLLKRPEWRIYDLRHTAASWLLQSGASLVTVRDMLGHTNLQMTGRYSHLEVSHLRLAVNRIKAPRR